MGEMGMLVFFLGIGVGRSTCCPRAGEPHNFEDMDTRVARR